ncbi:Transmembrane domain-containing protein [Spironucleus salmonicida]|uniref:Transmembrane domain-containing protein n=1 Tax=Spironucleus salmonicida TaxID=348837 RepID=V6LKQ4_9EUKA|nr:Transmembrane domain-containing protein [Spironucleus salmonicida]|eukprot:EST44943.1 Transmembrane domain-containing protein [Spironucleus salmonicida]
MGPVDDLQNEEQNQIHNESVNKIMTQSAFSMLNLEIIPTFVAQFAYVLHQFVSMHFQYNLIFNKDPVMFAIIYGGTSITQAFSAGTWMLFSQQASEALFNKKEERATYLNHLSFKISLFWTIVGFIVFYPIDHFLVNLYNIPSQLWFQYYITIALSMPIQTFFEGQMLRYAAEGRKTVAASLSIFYSIIFITIESLGYLFSTATSTWPTGLSYILTGLTLIVWTCLWNFGLSIFGAKNNQVILTNWKEIVSFKGFKGYFKDLFNILSLSSTLTLLKMCFGVAVLLAATQVQSQPDSFQQGQLLLVFSYFGQVFRIVSISLSQFFTRYTLICISGKQHKRLNEIIMKSIILGLVLTCITVVLFLYVPIIQTFVPLTADTASVSQAILFSGIGGFCQIFAEIALCLALAHQHYIIIGGIGVLNMAGIVATSFIYQIFQGQTGNFFNIPFWGEIYGGVSGLVVIVCYYISFHIKAKKENQDENKNKKAKKVK